MLKNTVLLLSTVLCASASADPAGPELASKPQILIPQMAKEKTPEYVGDDWFAVPRSFKGKLLKGAVKFKPAIDEEHGEVARFLTSDGMELPEDASFNYTYVRRIEGLAAEKVSQSNGDNCLNAKVVKKPRTCTLTLGKSKITIVDELSTKKNKEEMLLSRITIRPEGGKEIVTVASRITFAGDLNGDGKTDLIIETSDFTLKTDLYLSDPKSSDLKLVASAETNGC